MMVGLMSVLCDSELPFWGFKKLKLATRCFVGFLSFRLNSKGCLIVCIIKRDKRHPPLYLPSVKKSQQPAILD
jgi:hypothetical protein